VSTGGGTVELRACDPGVNAAAGSAVSPPAFEVLTLRAELMTQMLDTAKAPADVAACVANGVITTIGPSAMVALKSAPPNDPRLVTARDAAARAALNCGYSGPPGTTAG
jgi:hypothetical protein